MHQFFTAADPLGTTNYYYDAWGGPTKRAEIFVHVYPDGAATIVRDVAYGCARSLAEVKELFGIPVKVWDMDSKEELDALWERLQSGQALNPKSGEGMRLHYWFAPAAETF